MLTTAKIFFMYNIFNGIKYQHNCGTFLLAVHYFKYDI